MVYQFPPQVPISGVVFVLLLSLAAYGGLQYYRRGHKSELLAFISLMVSLSVLVIGSIFVDSVTSVELKLLGYNFMNSVLILFSLYSLLWFALAYSDNGRWVNRWTIGIAAGTIVVTSSAAILAPEYMYEIHGLVTKGPVTFLGVTFDEWVALDRSLKLPFRLLQVYSYIGMLLSAGILVRYLLRNQSDIYTGQAAALGIGIGSPLVANSLLFIGILPAEFNITDMSFAVTGVAFAIAIFRYRMLKVAPVGRRQLVDIIGDPVVMLNEDARVVDCNPAARDLVDAPDGWRGMPAEDFFAAFPDQFQRFAGKASVETEVSIQQNDSIRHFELDISPIRNDRHTATGTLVVLREVSDQKAREQKLHRQKQRLEQFASLVSHDLRNPLNVAQGRINLARRDCESEHLDAAADGIDRSLDLIDDLLKLARAGQDVSETEPISLPDIVETCWDICETAEASIEIDVEKTIRADKSRFRQLLENLIRNAVEHGGEGVAVEMGSLPDGFFIEDDGPGIAKEKRADVFKQGYSQSHEGTGLGLSIVKQIVEAHGWDIQISEGSEGGARFELTDVEVTDG